MRTPIGIAPALLVALAVGCGGATTTRQPRAAAATADAAATSPGTESAAGDPGAGAAADAPPAGKYRIVFDRPAKVGAKYKRSVKVTDSRQERLVDGKKTLKDTDHRVQVTLVAEEEVLAVTAKGRWQKIRLKTESFTAAGAKGDEPIVPPGTILTIERAVGDGDPTATSSAGELSKDAKKALFLAIPSNAKGVADDEIFGSKTPRAPGESWDVSREVAARDIGARGVQTAPELIEGNIRILSAREDRGEPCLEMAARLRVGIKGFAALPEGTTIESGAVTAEMTGLVPTDTTKPSRRTSSRAGLELVAKIPMGQIDGSVTMGTLTIASLTVSETTFEHH